jgi:hypothetical protein
VVKNRYVSVSRKIFGLISIATNGAIIPILIMSNIDTKKNIEIIKGSFILLSSSKTNTCFT